MGEEKRRRVTWFHRRVANPLMRRIAGHLPGQALIETIGRRSGLPRTTPVGGRLVASTFWFVSDHGYASAYMRNIQENPAVRIQLRGRWWEGIAVPMPEDDAHRRLRQLPWLNGLLVRGLGTDLLTVRVDLGAGPPGHFASVITGAGYRKSHHEGSAPWR